MRLGVGTELEVCMCADAFNEDLEGTISGKELIEHIFSGPFVEGCPSRPAQCLLLPCRGEVKLKLKIVEAQVYEPSTPIEREEDEILD